MLATVLLSQFVFGGALTTSAKLGDLSLAEAKVQSGKLFPLGSPKLTNGVRLFAIRYLTHDASGLQQEVSGLLAVPTGVRIKGLVLFCHGTIADRTNAPSNMTPGSDKGMEAPLATLAFAGGGYACVMPDYLGIGIHQGVHPFGQRINGITSADALTAARTWATKNNLDFGRKTFVSGYSEGGGISMWASRYLTEAGRAPTASAHLAGPYDLSGTMAQQVASRTSNVAARLIRVFFMAYFAYGVHAMDPSKSLEDIFVPSFASYIQTAFEKGGSEKAIQQRIANKALQVGALSGIQRVLQPAALKAFQTGDTNFWAIRTLGESDCFDWRVTTPTLLSGLTTDGIVPFANTRKAYAAMRKRAPKLVSIQPIENSRLDHVKAAPEAIKAARTFFDGH